MKSTIEPLTSFGRGSMYESFPNYLEAKVYPLSSVKASLAGMYKMYAVWNALLPSKYATSKWVPLSLSKYWMKIIDETLFFPLT